MKLKVSAFLMKEGVQRNAVLSQDARVNNVPFELNNTSFDFYWQVSHSRPKWLDLFAPLNQIDVAELGAKGVQGLLVFERRNRVLCFTFGHARHLINPLAIERYFGLKAALSLSDPDFIKSIDKSNIDKTPFRSHSQSSKYVSISEFEFKFDWEILKSLTGIVDTEGNGDDDYEVVTGSDSVSIFTDISLAAMPALAERLLDAYSDEGYKAKYPWIDYIVPVRDRTRVEQLDAILVSNINHGDFESVWAAAPRSIDHENFSGFCYERRKHGKSSPVTYPDLNLEQCLADKKMLSELDLQKAKSTQIFLFGADDQQIDAWTLYNCLNAEVEIDDMQYLLSEGDWYQVERNFSAQVNRYFDEFPRSDLELPNYDGRQEGTYLRAVADNVRFFLLDQKLIKPDGAASNIEFCDLLTHEHHLIHVKKYSSSSLLSHLFSQAYVSAEVLLHSPDTVTKVNAYLPEEIRFQFDANVLPRRSKIILAIMQHRAGDLHMPFFSKVNFKQYSQRLKAMGFAVELLKIAA